MNIQQELNKKGYKKYVSESNRVFKMTDTLFQKKVVDDKGIRYFIDCWWYEQQCINGTVIPESWQFETQFHGDKIDQVIDVMLFEKDIDKAEQMFNDMWVKLGLGYYEEYLDE